MRRSLLTLVAWLVWAAPAFAQVTFTQMKVTTNANAFETDATDTLTFDAQAAAGSFIVAGVSLSAANRTITSIVTNNAEALTLCTDGSQTATTEVAATSEIWLYCGTLTMTADTVTATISLALATPGRFFILEFDGQNATPIEDVVVTTSSGTTSHPVGPVVTAAAGNYLVGIAYGTTGVYTNNAGWTEVDNTTLGIAAYDNVDAASTSWTPTSSGNESLALVLMAIQPAAAASTCTGGLTLLGAGKCE